jgi:hypothetical protein
LEVNWLYNYNMSLFSRGSDSESFVVVIDIGSGSALAAIAHSNQKESSPTIIWFARENAPLKQIDSTAESAKAVKSALLNVLLRLDSEGRKVMSKYRSETKITDVQCTISAPWSYTITKNINYKQDEPFLVTEELIEELTRTAQARTENEMERADSVSQLGLVVVAQKTMSLRANGYKVTHTSRGKTPELTLVHASVVAQRYLLDSLKDLQAKLFPEADLTLLSYMMATYFVSQDLFPHLEEACLIDLTYEATEIGIVREAAMQYSTHTPFGIFSLAREISEITKVPIHEAFKYLHEENPYAFLDKLSNNQKADVEKAFDSYVDRLAALFHETGDELSIPKRMVVSTDAGTETLIKDLLEKATKRAIKSTPVISMLSEKILAKKEGGGVPVATDSAMLVATRFFHKRHRDPRLIN